MSKKIAILSASWHTDIVESAENSFIKMMGENGIGRGQIQIIKVPGALEIPLAGQMALENGFDLALGIGFVVDGGIYAREYVAHCVIQGIVDVSIKTGKPFLSTVMTPQKFEEGNKKHEAWFVDHMVIKGQEAAQACLRMLELSNEIKGLNKAA